MTDWRSRDEDENDGLDDETDDIPQKPPKHPPQFYSRSGELLDSYTMSPEQARAVEEYWDQVDEYETARENAAFDELAKDLKKTFGDVPDTDDGVMADAAWRQETKWRGRLRKEAESLSADPKAWVTADRMTQTETSLRVAFHLLEAGRVSCDVTVTLTGRELTTLQRPRFPVERYLEECGYTPTLLHIDRDWRTRYAKDLGKEGVSLSTQRGMWDIMTSLADGRRLLMLTTGSALKAYKGSWEHGVLRHLLGRALTRPDVQPDDVVVVTVPRTERNRKLITQVRESPLVMRSGIRICTIDRTGDLNGLSATDDQ